MIPTWIRSEAGGGQERCRARSGHRRYRRADRRISTGENRPVQAVLRSEAYAILGTLASNNAKNYAEAETDLRKSIDAFPEQVDPVAVLRLAIALDMQNKIYRRVEVCQSGGGPYQGSAGFSGGQSGAGRAGSVDQAEQRHGARTEVQPLAEIVLSSELTSEHLRLQEGGGARGSQAGCPYITSLL